MEFIQRRNEEETSKGLEPYYEAVLILEGDSRVQTIGWLDRVLDEMKSKAPFAILGSKYKGHSWDNFRDQMPKALLEHINGNAVYNVTHPLTEHYVAELKEEELTYFNAIPYDYRISQMISEGRYRNYSPEFPFPEMRDESGKFSVTLPSKRQLFKLWWTQWGGEGDANPIKESSVIHNWVSTVGAHFPHAFVQEDSSLTHFIHLYLFHLHSLGCNKLPPGTHRRQCPDRSRKGCLGTMGSSETRHYPSRVGLDRGLCQVAPLNSRLHRPSILEDLGNERAERLAQQSKEHV